MSTLNISKRIRLSNPAANIDSTYGPYNSVSEANAAVNQLLRVIGRTVIIDVAGTAVEYWWESGVEDSDLVEKVLGTNTDIPVILFDDPGVSLKQGVTAAEVRSLIGAGTGSGEGDITAVTTPNAGGLSGGVTTGDAVLSLKNSGNLTSNTLLKWDSSNKQLSNSGITDNGSVVTIAGDLNVQGTTTTINSTISAIGDNMMKYADENTANLSDIGWYGQIVDGGTKYPTMFYDANSGVTSPVFKVGIATAEPGGTATIATIGTIEANITGNISGTADNVTGTVLVANGGTGATDAAGARTNLGVVNDTGIPAISYNSSTLGLASGVTEAGIRTFIGAGTGDGTMSRWLIKTGNTSVPVDDGETLTIAAGSGISTVFTSNSSGGTISISNDQPDTGRPAILSDGATPSLNTNITADEIKVLLDLESSVTDVEDYSGLAVSSNILTTIYDTTILDDVLSVPTGGAGAAPASDWKDKTIVQVLDTILFPTILASVKSSSFATLNLSVSTNAAREVGTVVPMNLTATLDRGQIKNGDGSTNQNPLIGSAINYTFEGTGISTTTQESNVLAISPSIVEGTNQWDVDIAHSAGGGVYYSNKNQPGSNLDSPTNYRAAGTLSDSSPIIRGRYKQFFGAGTSTITTSAQVRALSSNFDNTNSFQITIDQTHFTIAIPVTRTLVKVNTQNNDDIVTQFVLSTFNVDDAGDGSVAYKVYSFNTAIPLDVTATVTIS